MPPAADARPVPVGSLARGVAVLGLLVAAGGAAAAEDDCPRWRRAFAAMPTRTIVIGVGARSVPLRVKVADVPEHQQAGFQCATAQEIERHQILFDFGREIVSAFHMNNVRASLDIAFIKATGRFFAILSMQPSPTALYQPMGAFRYALEARAGFFERLGIRQGEARLVVDR
jgi:uncharacterized membrane protein (UPF0127 family)